jgi:hypothetical protein
MNSVVWQMPVSHSVIEEDSDDFYAGEAIVRTHVIADKVFGEDYVMMRCPECIYEQVGAEAYDKYSHIPKATALRSDKRPKDNKEELSFSECKFGLDKNGEHVKHVGARISEDMAQEMYQDLELV